MECVCAVFYTSDWLLGWSWVVQKWLFPGEAEEQVSASPRSWMPQRTQCGLKALELAPWLVTGVESTLKGQRNETTLSANAGGTHALPPTLWLRGARMPTHSAFLQLLFIPATGRL